MRFTTGYTVSIALFRSRASGRYEFALKCLNPLVWPQQHGSRRLLHGAVRQLRSRIIDFGNVLPISGNQFS